MTGLFRPCYVPLPRVDRVSAAPQTPSNNRWPGERLGLPETGPRSIGRIGRRVAALVIDWGIAYLLAWWWFPTDNGADGFATLAIFAALQYIFLVLVNGSVGHLFLRLRVVPATGGYLGVVRPLVRTLLLCLVIPAAIWDRDQRGLHDRGAGTILVRI